MTDTLYSRLGGYDGIVAVADNLLPRLVGDEELGRFWAHRGDDGGSGPWRAGFIVSGNLSPNGSDRFFREEGCRVNPTPEGCRGE